MRTISFFRYLLFLCVIFSGCKKDDNPNTQPVINLPDLVSKIQSSSSGFVTDENNDPVQGATVKFGNQSTLTDEYGYYEFRDVLVVKEAATITVVNTGYFNAIKTFAAIEGRSAFFRIKLLPKLISGTFSTSSGGDVTLPNGLKISFPANGIKNAATGAAYSGTVSVAAQWIDPASDELNYIMPGDLRGLEESGEMKLLITYGMAAVELTGSGGELLQLATGSKANLTTPVPASLLSNAPSKMPLWYFDETKGLWIEDGEAIKAGNTYVGEVSHFSFWNFDVPSPFIRFDVTVKDNAGIPLKNVMVKVSLAAQPNNIGFGYTDDAGYVSGFLPANTQLTLQVMGGSNCNNSLYTQSLTTTTVNISLADILIPATATGNISGNLVDCNGNGVANGYLIIVHDHLYHRYPVPSNGAFNIPITVCSGGSSINITGQDADANIQSLPSTHTINTGINNIGNITACTVSTSQFVNYSVNGINHAFTEPPDNIGINGINDGYEMFAYRIPSTGEFTRFKFSNIGIAANTAIPLIAFNSSDIMNNATVSTGSILVNITEFGPVGGYIAGNFSGTLNNISNPGSPYQVTCNFRILRWF